MNNTEYLQHFGVKGMKWGVRRARKASSASARDAANLRKYGYTKEADAVQKVSDKQRRKADDLQRKLDSRRDVRNSKIYKVGSKINKANSTRKKIKKEYRDIMVRESPFSRAIYSPQVYKKAAKNVVKKGMDRKTAIKKAKTSAWIQTGAAAATSALSMLAMANANKIAKYANERSIQKANASLARIGTFTYKKVAGDVYERVMR